MLADRRHFRQLLQDPACSPVESLPSPEELAPPPRRLRRTVADLNDMAV